MSRELWSSVQQAREYYERKGYVEGPADVNHCAPDGVVMEIGVVGGEENRDITFANFVAIWPDKDMPGIVWSEAY